MGIWSHMERGPTIYSEPRAVTDQEWMEALGRRLARLREAKDLTLVDAARRAGLSRRTLYRAERGENPTLLTVVRMLRVYGRLDTLAAMIPADPGASPAKRLGHGGGDGEGRRLSAGRVAEGEAGTTDRPPRERQRVPTAVLAPAGPPGSERTH